MQTKKDMYLPKWVCVLGSVFLIGAAVCLICSFTISVYALLGFVVCLCIGIAAVLCWKNQWAEMINDHEFIYSTMFGKKTKYRFSAIRNLKQNSDSVTLYFDNGKIHIESCAIISEEFAEKINHALERI